MKMVRLMAASLLMGVGISSFAAQPLSDRELRATAEADTATLHTSIILQCPKDMEAIACERLKTLRYAREGQTQNSYELFLNDQIDRPISNTVKQPLMTQPMERRAP